MPLLRKAFLIFSVNLMLVSAPWPLYSQQAAKPQPRPATVQANAV